MTTRLYPSLRPRLALARLRRSQRLASLLAPYQVAADVEVTSNEPYRGRSLLSISQLESLAQRLEVLTERLGVHERLTSALARAGARVKVGEALTIWLLSSAVLAGFGWVLAGPAGAGIVLLLAFAVPLAALQLATDHRAKLFAEQLPDVLKLTASSLRAGFSLLQGLEAVTKQLQEPCAGEFQRVLSEARLGRPVEEALEAAAARIANSDFSESVAAVRIQQEAGGNLAALFDTLAGTMLQRLQLRREIRALTAEARLSAYVLGAMPLVLAIFLFVVDRPYVLELFRTKPGQIAILVAAVLQVLGFFWMYRTIKVETKQ